MRVRVKPRFDIIWLQFVDGLFAVDFCEGFDVVEVPFERDRAFGGLNVLQKGIENDRDQIGPLRRLADQVLECVLGSSFRCGQSMAYAIYRCVPGSTLVSFPRFWYSPHCNLRDRFSLILYQRQRDTRKNACARSSAG